MWMLWTRTDTAAEEPTRAPDAGGDESATEADEAAGGIEELTGLHAKLYVADRGWKTHIWTGSANATDAAFKHNVEFLVELRGPRRRARQRAGTPARRARGGGGGEGGLAL